MRKIKRVLRISLANNNQTILQSEMPPLDLKNLDQKFQQNMKMLKQTAAHHQVISLAANQVRMQYRLFAILKEPLIVAGKWTGYEYKPQDYEIIVNPERVSEKSIRFKDFQQCPSLPGMKFAVWNPIFQSYLFDQLDIKGEKVTFKQNYRDLKGFNARVWDHQVRHLDGILAISDQISHGEISVNDQYRDNPGMHEMVELTKKQLKFMSEQSLKRFFKNPSTKQDFSMNPDKIPQKLTKQMKNKYNKQYKQIIEQLQRQKKQNKQDM